MVLSKIQVRLEIEHEGSAIKRWLSTALVPLGKHSSTISVTGEAVIAESEGKTRSTRYSFTTSGEVSGKICVYESFDERSADQALLYAKKAGARALLVAHKPPYVAVTIPTILISQEQYKFIKGLPNLDKAVISVVPISESYTGIKVTLKAKRISGESSPYELQSKMFVPTSMLKETISSLEFGVMIDTAPFIYRDRDDKIASGDDRFSGKICLFNALHPGDSRRAVELATEHGARALVIYGKDTPDWSNFNLTLPALAIDRYQFEGLKRAGLHSTELGVSISYGTAVHTADEENKPSSLQQGRKVDSPSSTPPKRHQPPREAWQAKSDPPESTSLLGGVYEWGKKKVFGYSPKSKEEFDAIARNGTSWSYDGPNYTPYRNAMCILGRIRKIESWDDQEEEMKLLMKTIVEMTEKQDFVGDVLVLLFCAHLFSLKEDLIIRATFHELDDAMVIMVNGIIIDNVSELELTTQEETVLDQCILRLTRRISHRSSNISNHAMFVLNAIWIRSHHCGKLQGSWEDLQKITSLKYIEIHQDAILAFMEPLHFNTLILTSIALDLADVCRMFDGYDAVPVLPNATKRLQEIYERNKLARQTWIDKHGETRELTVLNLIGRLAVRKFSKESIIRSVIKRASFETAKSFHDLDTIYSSAFGHTNYDIISSSIEESICGSLSRKGKSCPTASDVSSALQASIRWLLLNKTGWKTIMTFLQNVARANHNEKDELELFGHIYDLFFCQLEWCEDRSALTDDLVRAISHCIRRSTRHDSLAVAAFQVASSWDGIFTDPKDPSKTICLPVAKLIITQTGLASTIRCQPLMLHDISSFQVGSSSGTSLIECLFRELIQGLTTQCSKIEDAISFCISANSSMVPSAGLGKIVSEIILNSFSNWSPSSLDELLNVDGYILARAYTFLSSLPQGDIAKGEMYAQSIKSIISKWIMHYNNDGYDTTHIGKLASVWTEEKKDVLTEISGKAFPTKIELEEKMSTINHVVGAIRSMLTFHSKKDGTPISHSILDLAKAYRINTDDGSLLDDMISKYFCGAGGAGMPVVSLANIYGDRDGVGSFLEKHERELQAAAHFLTNKCVLFRHEVGTWPEIHLEVFLAKIASTLSHLTNLLSPGATFSVILEAAKVIAEEDVIVESELKVISSFDGIITSSSCLHHSMAVAMISQPLQKFIECCKTFKFMFVAHDEAFSELSSICEHFSGEDGLGLHEMGIRIADILVPDTASSGLGDRLRSCLPTLQFFSALRLCGNTFTMAKERMWFGEEGLKTFYNEYGNVSNVFTSNQSSSFENELLDRLEPTIRVISAVGGALGCSSVASLLKILEGHDDIYKLEEMRLVQAHISKVQDWFTEGMDDMAAILKRFAIIQKYGRFIMDSETSEDSAVPKRTLVLQYSRSQTDNKQDTMTENDIKEFVQYLGFVNHDSDKSTGSAAFSNTYRQLSQVREIQQAMVDVGFSCADGDNFCTSKMEYAIHNPESPAEVDEWLDESRQKLKQCNDWLKEVRSKYRYSLLFWMGELQYIFQCMSKLRSMDIGRDIIIDMPECEPVEKILEAISRLSPHVSQQCSDVILTYVNASPSEEISWLEDVSNLVNICGQFSERLNLPCFQAVEPACHKKIMIHKMNCSEDMVFAAPLRLLQHIYKNRCPASFEVLDAACIKSQDEIHLFLDRVLAFPDQSFTILSIEELHSNEQEIIANFLAKYSRSADEMHLHCIQLRDTILYAPPGVEVCLWDDSSLNDEEHHSWLQNNVIHDRHIHAITVVGGSSCGSGKTLCIRGEMEKLAANKASIYIHEDFCLSKAVLSLRNKFKQGTSRNRAIHFGFALAADGNPKKDLMLSVNNFFNSFLLLQSIYDPSSGTFHSGMHSYHVFVELDCAENEQTCRAWLKRYVPILSCCNGVIQPPLEYIIDERTRRVCTYLRAYDDIDSSTQRRAIDRKFNPTPCNKRIIFVLDKSGSMEMEWDLGIRAALEVASDCMLTIFDSHVQLMDHVGLIRFNHEFEELIPLQRVDDDGHRGRLRNTMYSARNNPCGNTRMFTALSHAVSSLDRGSDADGDAWIICLTDGESWDTNTLLKRQLQASSNNLHIILVGVNLDQEINKDMEDLCAKYQPENPRNKGFFLPTSANMLEVEQAFSQVAARIPVSQTFELDGIMSDTECRDKLEEHRPEFICPENKLLYSFWVNFLYRRVTVFDENDDFNYNEDHDTLGSSLMEVMLSESRQMLQREQNRSWTSSNHTQLIYDFSQHDNPQFRLICTSPDNLDRHQREKLSQLKLPGFSIPTTAELRKRETLDRYLSQALSVPLNEGQDGRKSLKCVDDNKFVLTLDFCLKLLNIHERVSCGVPCLMEGETGVSKTALTKMYSILVNSQQNSLASASTLQALALTLTELCKRFPTVVVNDDCGIADSIRKFLEPSTQHNAEEASQLIQDLINQACSNRNALFASIPQNLVEHGLLDWFSESKLEPTFFDINIHGSLTADDLKRKIDEARRVAQKISHLGVKTVIFLDEINTSDVLGLLKEMIVDHSINGDRLEDNIIFIAACNPVRQTVSKPSREIDLGRNWASGHYQVKKLPLSLSSMAWDYGSLNSEQEKEFIHHRIIMMDEQISDVMARGMTEMISCSHEMIRLLAEQHIRESLEQHSPEAENDAALRARSVVSLRDIQRVFHLLNFFLCDFSLGSQLTGQSTEKFRRAMLISVGIVYYLRLDSLARRKFLQKLESLPSEHYQDCYLLEVLDSAIETLIKQTEIPEGIALTRGLKENVFMITVCTFSRTPIMIVGPPGSSKTLAVSIVTDNANGEESPSLFYRNYARIQPFHYQCSKTSTSNEVASVFDRAIQRQSKVNRTKQQCLVFMDEAGLPEEEKESLKVLHYLLEGHMSNSPEVGFVCITNHILDAAKSNRCVCLLRPEPDKDELMCIAMGVLCQKHKGDIKLVSFGEHVMALDAFSGLMCEWYLDLIQNKAEFGWFVQFFGLRDFIHMIIYIRRTAPLRGGSSVLDVSAEVMLHSLERNFNGVSKENFSNVCASFLAKFMTDINEGIEECMDKFCRHPMNVLQDSLSEVHPVNASRYNLPRYKMIIDNSGDDSVTRLLQMSGILNSSHSFYKLSGLEEGSEVEQLNIVSRIKFAAQQGDKTVVMSQVEDISECFYDLFNQHFKEFKKDGKVSYFANIAIGGISRPCIIHPSFQCIVHVQSNQLDDIPAPFLNRFEKFQLNISDILSWQLSRLPRGIGCILSNVLYKCEKFLSQLGNGSIWSSSPDDTLKSIFISMIPPDSDTHVSEPNEQGSLKKSISSSVSTFLKRWLVIRDINDGDIQQAIATSLCEGIDGIEMRKLLDIEGCLDQSQLEQTMHDLAIGGPISPLSRSLKKIVEYTILRHVIIQLLHVAMPEAVFLQREYLPKDVLHAYFGGCHNHFDLKSLISNLGHTSRGNQLFMLNIHSDSCAHSLPTWCGGHASRDHDGDVFKSIVENIVHENSAHVEIHHLDLLKSESSVRNTIESWASKEEVDCFILVVDMQLHSSSNLVNFIRSHIEQMRLAPTKKFLLLLHYPLSCEKPSYPALFLGNWQCVYLDGIGYRGASSSHLSVNNVFEAACFEDYQLNADSLLALLPKAIQYVSSQLSFHSCSPYPQSVNQNMQFTERQIKIEAILKRQIKGASLGMLVCKKYLRMWTKDAISEMLVRAAHGLKSGTTHLSLSSAVRSMFQHTFNKFLANSILDINIWSNLDVLEETDSETDSIFLLVLSALPVIPLKELQLQRDVYRHLHPLPLEMTNSKASVFFPFYYQISSFIDLALDKASASSDFLMDQNGFHNIMEKFGEMLDRLLLENPGVDESMAGMAREVIKAVEASSGLFEKYLKHLLLWKFGIEGLSHGIKWVSNKIKEMTSSTSPGGRNIVFLHIFCRIRGADIIRMSSWDLASDSTEHLTEDFSLEEVKFGGIHLVGTMLSHFKTSIFEHSADSIKEWSYSFSTFLQSIPNLVGDEDQIDVVSVVGTLRQLVFLSAIINVNAPETAVSQMVEHLNVPSEHTMGGFFELLDNVGSDEDSWVEDAKDKLFRTLFSPGWLKSVSDNADSGHSDANFLIDSIKMKLVNHQAAVVHLRNLLLHGNNNNHQGMQSLLPTKCFSQSIALLLCRNLSCQGISDFCEETQQRNGMPHYIPSWLCGNAATASGEIDDEISWFFQNYRNAFDCPLADVIFDIMLGLLADRVREQSEQLLLLFQQTIGRERAISRREHIRRARQILQPPQKDQVSFIGTCLGALEADALLVSLVCSIAKELSTTSQASALCGIGSNSATRVLDLIMGAHRWPELFFSTVLRLRGSGHLAALLGEGGALNSFEWCTPWKQGILSLRQDILTDLTEARDSLQQAEDDAARFSQQYQACPYCRGIFGVDQMNCGQFTCGRDAHGVNGGGPAIGGQAVQGTFGCGRTFSHNQALRYEQSNQYTEDQAALRELREDLERKQMSFNEFNESAQLWRRTEQFDVPCMSFHVQRQQINGVFPGIHLVDFMPEGTRILVSILNHLPTLEHLSYLPDMIELYVFVHKTFRHMVTKEMSMNMTIGDIMDESLLTRRFGSIESAHLRRVWLRVVEGVNAFLNANESVVLWNCEEVNVPFQDLKNSSLISILSEMAHPSDGHDYLFLIINDLILRYNNYVQNMSAIASTRNIGEKVGEIHPKSLVHLSKSSVIVNGAVSSTQSVINQLVESYWMKDDRNFNMESLTRAICCDMGIVAQPIKSPLTFLREKFAFQECSLNVRENEDASACCFHSSDGLFFARNEDLSLYEEVKESAKKIGFVQGKRKITHTMIVTFHSFSYAEWTGLLEGLRNVLGQHGSEFLCGNDQFGRVVTNLQRILGFPILDDTQSNFLNSVTIDDLLEVICVCGEQLSSEVYRYVGIPNRLAEPLPNDTEDSMKEGILRLLKSKRCHDIITELDTFSKDVLEFYCERLIIPSSESSNEGLSAFLKRNNCCDESDNIFAVIPQDVSVRHYISVQKVLHQAKLKLLFDSLDMVPTADASDQSRIHKGTSSKWEWTMRPRSQDQRYRWKAFGNLWFEDALSKGRTASEEPEAESDISDSEEKKEDVTALSMDGDHNITASQAKNTESSIPVKEDALTEQGVGVNEPPVEDASTEQDADAPIITDMVTEKGKMGDEEDRSDDTNLVHRENAESATNYMPMMPYVLGATLIIVAILVIAVVYTMYTPSPNHHLDETVVEEDIVEALGPRVNQCDVGSSDEACSYGDED